MKTGFQRHFSLPAVWIILTLLIAAFLVPAVAEDQPYAGEVVTLYAWGGDDRTNAYLDDVLAPFVREQTGIELRRVPMDAVDFLARLSNEVALGASSDLDLLWINGENFYSAKENGLLYGPFTDSLENLAAYVDPDSVSSDFGVPVEGYESPWGRAQFVFFYDSAEVADAPSNSAELLKYAKAHPGTFTYPQSADFTASAFLRTVLYDLIDRDVLDALEPDYDAVLSAIQPAVDYLNELEPYLWRGGETYPTDSTQLEALYQDGEVLFAMDYSANKALSMVADGLWPATTRTLVWDKGTPYNIHFLAIAGNSQHPEAAAQVINATLSPEMQIAKADLRGWADLPVLTYDRLSEDQQSALNEALKAPDEYAATLLPFEELDAHKQSELRADLVDIIEQIWVDTVLNK
ncbi:MAG: ABC transporter substrate-binding protein [Clostridia bacterium]|nr:ABC transporter substrate-binding protein [Clostridia bacterium]